MLQQWCLKYSTESCNNMQKKLINEISFSNPKEIDVEVDKYALNVNQPCNIYARAAIEERD